MAVAKKTPAALGFRMPAEWEPQEAVWFSWPHNLKTWPGYFRPIPAKFAEIVAHISHLPQILASTLCAFLTQRDPAWRDFAGGGLRDTTRIAGSDPQLWRTILEQNRTEVLGALQHYQAELNRFEKALAAGDYAALTEQLQRGQDYRRGLRPAS